MLFIDSTVERLDFEMKCDDGETHQLYISQMSVKDMTVFSELIKPFTDKGELSMRQFNLARVAVLVKKQDNGDYFYSHGDDLIDQFDKVNDRSIAELVNHINVINPLGDPDSDLDTKKKK